ncbi:MAG TPA: response regulator, partial [Ktedonobacteraceae bacterium]|nr:response regulator [Ktedonobacteraceae bacterium]
MKILIADDESLARVTLRSMLQELPIGVELLDDATNGEELIDLVKRHEPDMVFVDIRMPRLNGLEAMKAVKRFAPNARWFILTGFSEFSYAQEALRMGAADYLLKPVSPQDLIRAVTEVTNEHKKRLLLLNQQFEHELTGLFHGLNSLSRQEGEGIFHHGHFMGALFAIDSFLPEAEKAELQRAFFQQVRVLTESLVTPEIKMALLVLPNGEIAWIGAWEAEATPGEQLCHNALHLIEQVQSDHSNDHFCITLLRSTVCTPYLQLSEQLHWLQKFAFLRVLYGTGKKMYVKDLACYEKEPEKLEIGRLLSEIGFYYREKTYVRYLSAIDHLMHLLAASKELNYGAKRSIGRFLGFVCACPLTPEQDLAEWQKQLEASGEQMLLISTKKESGDIFEQVLVFTERYYQSPIGLAQIA